MTVNSIISELRMWSDEIEWHAEPTDKAKLSRVKFLRAAADLLKELSNDLKPN